MRWTQVLLSVLVAIMLACPGQSLKCLVCSGPYNECRGDNQGFLTNCTTTGANKGNRQYLMACVEQKMVITDPDESRLFRYCTSRDYYHFHDDVTDEDNNSMNFQSGCDYTVWHVDQVDYYDKKCFCGEDGCNKDCSFCDQYDNCQK